MASSPSFEDLVVEAEPEPVEGWDFSWLDGRATEERPSWGYSRMLAERMALASAALDIQTGGAEVLAQIPAPPAVLFATESWPPHVEIARENLRQLGGRVVAVDDDADLPFDDHAFDLVVSRHPTFVIWNEIARVLRPRGTYLSQGVGAGSNRELTGAMMGPQPRYDPTGRAAAAFAEQADLEVIDLRHETLRLVFYDIGAMVYFLRKVIWTVPDSTASEYRGQLAELHRDIQRDGSFVAHGQRYLIEAQKPN
jgi:SAM-dependent methyltransferase